LHVPGKQCNDAGRGEGLLAAVAQKAAQQAQRRHRCTAKQPISGPLSGVALFRELMFTKPLLYR
jgi:hypothetical protein